ncbi:hypothetical protein RHODGE_RHODGE_03739 [Rhodoplanes serenus]|uniref:Uncharacterized protein n=1 Tax=Rhodoplanes serenus TaxID=200615 RepID=A0A3S4FBR2_9BRAD|nr:hypothetical protein [Rhodoplanes serenus]VCU10540.1 hypothetical protein RHODGE_RHODGE_03739 [Rhodoplanes serenus]
MAKKITSTASRIGAGGKRSVAVTAAKPRMAKNATAKRVASQPKPLSKSYEIVGRTRDGVSILGPAVEPTHFTSDEIRKTIRDVLGKR